MPGACVSVCALLTWFKQEYLTDVLHASRGYLGLFCAKMVKSCDADSN